MAGRTANHMQTTGFSGVKMDLAGIALTGETLYAADQTYGELVTEAREESAG
jgi:hypothetical protein